MFTAKVYKICIASASGAMKEERIAQDVVARWNCHNGEGREPYIFRFFKERPRISIVL